MWYSSGNHHKNNQRIAAWSRNLQRLKRYLEGDPLVSSSINDQRHVDFVRNYAKKHNLPPLLSEEAKTASNPYVKKINMPVMMKERPEIAQEYQQFLEAKQQWLSQVPPEAMPYIDNIFSNTPEDMVEYNTDWGWRKKDLQGRLNTLKYALQQKGIEIPKAFDWKNYPPQEMKPYVTFEQKPFIDWDKYFTEHPDEQVRYEKFKDTVKEYPDYIGFQQYKDPRDMILYNPSALEYKLKSSRMEAPDWKGREEYPDYSPYINQETSPVSTQDMLDYLWKLPEEHKNTMSMYFSPFADQKDYGTDQEVYFQSDDPEHGNARAYVNPNGYGQGWMVHHTPNAEQIAQEGFQKGVAMSDIESLVKTEGGSNAPGFNYAFETSHPNPSWNGGKAVVFPGHFMRVYHGRNEDSYVLFDGTDVPPENIFPIVYENSKEDGQTKYGWSVYDASGRKRIDMKPLKEVLQWVEENNGMLQDVKKKQAKNA